MFGVFFKFFDFFYFAHLWSIFTEGRSFKNFKNSRHHSVGKTIGFPFSEPFSLRNITCGQGLWTMDWHNSLCALIVKKGASKTTTPTAAETSCKNHFSFSQKYHACKMRSNYPTMKLLSAVSR